MADETSLEIVLPDTNKEAKIILDWDDGQWYISSIQNADGSIVSSETDASSTVDSTSGVKVAVWDPQYKYNMDDIVGSDGSMYVSKQNQNKGNLPSDGTFWWYPLVDLSNVNAVTLEGKNLEEISREILGGSVITDFYKKQETNNIILKYVNNVNAKLLNDWSLQTIKDDYNALIDAAKDSAQLGAIEYFKSDTVDSYQQELIDNFNDNIAVEDINQNI